MYLKKLLLASICLVILISAVFITSKQKEIKSASQNNSSIITESNKKAKEPDTKFTMDQLANAVLENDVDLVNKIINSNTININDKDSNEKYPLEMVLAFDNCDMAKILLKAGANPYAIISDNISIYDTVMKSDNKYMKNIFEKYKK